MSRRGYGSQERMAGKIRQVRRATFKDWLEYVVAKCFVLAMQALPAKLALRIANLLGVLIFDVIRYRRDVALANLRSCLGGVLGEGELRSIARRSYASFAMALADLARLPLVDDRFISKHIKIAGLHHLDRLRRESRGAILVTGHFGSWELLGYTMVRLGYPVVFVVGVQRNPLVQDLMNQLRTRAGIEIIERSSTLAIMRSLRQGKFVAMLADQDARRRGVFVTFFGKPASTPIGPARLALWSGSPIVTGFIMRDNLLDFRVVIEEPIMVPEGMDEASAVAELTQRFTSRLETHIRSKPDHWLWSHRRWKSSPP